MNTRTRWRLAAGALLGMLVATVGIPAVVQAVRAVDRRGTDAGSVVTTHIAPDGTEYRQISAGPANAWLLPADDGYFLIDTGYPEDYDRFVAGLEYVGIDIADIRYLFITHAHDEHAGFAARLKRETGCTLILPRRSLEGLASGRFDWEGVSVNLAVEVAGRLYNSVKRRDFSFEPVVPQADDIILDESTGHIARSWGVKGSFVPTPGHSADSWSLVMDDGRAFVGDAAMNYLTFLGTGRRPIFMEDRRGVYESMDLLRATGAELILTGHGPPFPVDELPRFQPVAAAGPGPAGLMRYSLQLAPGIALAVILLWLTRRGSRSFRIWIYILAFIFMRDLMTPLGLWSVGSDPVFWLRFAADGPILFTLASGSLLVSLLIMAFERGRGPALVWFTNRRIIAIGAALLAAGVVAAPVLLLRSGILPGEVGGAFPPRLLPAVLAIALAGNLLEELLFRGYLQAEFVVQGLHPTAAAIASGVAFGFGHLFLAFTVTSAGFALVLFTLWEGIMCGFMRLRFGLAAAVITHGAAIALIAAL
jgi:glyoxylase-like metal-dependent hydrolase (beta-lactamase superfamily II)/membrane protease YdiL (CAAX protease family)